MTTPTTHEGPETMGSPDPVEGALDRLPVPPLDPATSARALRRARSELRMRGEGTISLAGFLALWDTSAVPLLVLLTGAAYGALAVARMVEIFVAP